MAVEFVKGVTSWSHLPDDGRPEVAFLGRSNVGKSSLLNAFVGQKGLARISGTPGKTQQFNYFLIDERYYLVDVPGLGYAKVSQTQRLKWERLIGRYVTEHPALRLVVHLIDSRHDLQPMDEALIDLLEQSPVRKLLVLTKADKLSKNQQQARVATLKRLLKGQGLEWPIALTSATTKQGMDEVQQWVETLLL